MGTLATVLVRRLSLVLFIVLLAASAVGQSPELEPPEALKPAPSATGEDISQQLREVDELRKKLGDVTVELQQEQARVEQVLQDARRQRRNRFFLYAAAVGLVAVGAWFWRSRRVALPKDGPRKPPELED